MHSVSGKYPRRRRDLTHYRTPSGGACAQLSRPLTINRVSEGYGGAGQGEISARFASRAVCPTVHYWDSMREANFVMNGSRPLVVLVHGIRDIARCQADIRQTLEASGFDVELINYDRMNLIEFLIPILYFRNKAIDIVSTQLQQAIVLHPGATVSIIAHSFGTCIISEILRRNFAIKFERIIFCGRAEDLYRRF